MTLTGDWGTLAVLRLKGDGEEGPAADARFRVLVDRARPGSPEGDLVRPLLVRLMKGEASPDIDDEVADLGMGERGNRTGAGTGWRGNWSSAFSTEGTEFSRGGEMAACTGERGADMDDGGVGTPRNCCSRRIEISLFASEIELRRQEKSA